MEVEVRFHFIKGGESANSTIYILELFLKYFFSKGLKDNPINEDELCKLILQG